MQTEPIGFKGTSGNWHFEQHSPDMPKYFGNIISYLGKGENGIMSIRTITIQLNYATECENKANAELMAASKKMAIALQQICELSQTIGDAYEMQKIAKEALKEAGL